MMATQKQQLAKFGMPQAKEHKRSLKGSKLIDTA